MTIEAKKDIILWEEENYEELRKLFEDELMEHWYSKVVAQESDDGWEDFVLEEYEEYLSN